jgi:hypothetical protein
MVAFLFHYLKAIPYALFIPFAIASGKGTGKAFNNG